ncbi:MAG: type I-U CRISPR-associated protein Csb2 [Pirellula sp.]
MIAIGIRYLCGWAMATHPADRNRAEWPPHPDRVFMALAAAHFETDSEAPERNVLEWLEGQEAPHVIASDSMPRAIVTSFVPVNDASMPRLRAGKEPSLDQIKGGLSVLPEFRSRQPRTFPVAIPHDDTVFLVWPTVNPTPAQREALTSLCGKVTYVGHSASLVQMWVDEGTTDVQAYVPPNGLRRVLQPDDRGTLRLRVSGDGRLAALRSRFETQQRPTAGLWKGYREFKAHDAEPTRRTVFDSDLIVLRFLPHEHGWRLGLESTLQVTAKLREMLLPKDGSSAPEWLSGKRSDGAKSERTHVALIPLSHIGRAHADGHLLGVAIILPREVPADEQRQSIGTLLFDDDGLPRELPLHLDEVGTWSLQLDDRDSAERPQALRPDTWTDAWRETPVLGFGPARRWATVTPIVLDRFPESLEEATDIVALACERVIEKNAGGPAFRPVSIELQNVSAFAGVGHAKRDFPPLPEKFRKSLRFHHHAVITFAEPVRGPLLLGSGRYLGYGLCRPLRDEGDEQP